MSLLKNLKSDGLEKTGDRLGGFSLLETDIYTGPIKVAYHSVAATGAQAITLIITHGDNQEYRETLWITNKSGENWFVSKENKKVPLPGYVVINDICMCTTGKSLSEQDSAEKVVNVWDAEAHKELPKSVPVLTELTSQIISLGIVKQIENKSVKDDSGVYQPTAETRESNVIDKVFHTETKMSLPEATAGAEKAAFWDLWVNKNKGQTRNKVKDVGGGAPGRPGAPRTPAGPPQAGAAAPARKSLFGGK